MPEGGREGTEATAMQGRVHSCRRERERRGLPPCSGWEREGSARELGFCSLIYSFSTIELRWAWSGLSLLTEADCYKVTASENRTINRCSYFNGDYLC